MRNGREWRGKFREAASGTLNVTVTVEAQRERYSQIRAEFPFILSIESGAVEREVLRADLGERLCKGLPIRQRAIEEVCHRVECH